VLIKKHSMINPQLAALHIPGYQCITTLLHSLIPSYSLCSLYSGVIKARGGTLFSAALCSNSLAYIKCVLEGCFSALWVHDLTWLLTYHMLCLSHVGCEALCKCSCVWNRHDRQKHKTSACP